MSALQRDGVNFEGVSDVYGASNTPFKGCCCIGRYQRETSMSWFKPASSCPSLINDHVLRKGTSAQGRASGALNFEQCHRLVWPGFPSSTVYTEVLLIDNNHLRQPSLRCARSLSLPRSQLSRLAKSHSQSRPPNVPTHTYSTNSVFDSYFCKSHYMLGTELGWDLGLPLTPDFLAELPAKLDHKLIRKDDAPGRAIIINHSLAGFHKPGSGGYMRTISAYTDRYDLLDSCVFRGYCCIAHYQRETGNSWIEPGHYLTKDNVLTSMVMDHELCKEATAEGRARDTPSLEECHKLIWPGFPPPGTKSKTLCPGSTGDSGSFDGYCCLDHCKQGKEKACPGGVKGRAYDAICCQQHYELHSGKPWTSKSWYATLADAEAAFNEAI